MANQMDNRNKYSVLENAEGGDVHISNEVIAGVTKLATKEIEGVHSMAGNITNDIVGKLGMKNLTKGVKVAMEGRDVIIDIAINMEYGYNIPKTCKAVQERVKQKVELMTGLRVASINVRVAGVCDESEPCTGTP